MPEELLKINALKTVFRTEAGTASIILLSEPVAVFVLAFLLLGQPIDLWQILGGVLVLSAGVLVAR